MQQFGWFGSILAIVLLAICGCHRGAPEDVPLFDRKIAFQDKFYDVQSLSAERAIIVGYAGKILMTDDGGVSWQVIESGTRNALYNVEFINSDEGWICGQEGLVLHTTDGGKTWTPQRSGTLTYLFAIDFIDNKEGWIVGDRAMYLHTADGGRTWRPGKMPKRAGISAEEALVSQDPVLYDVTFVDRLNGWVVGEFGKIYHTSDGGNTWAEQEEALLGEGGVYDALDIPTFFGVSFIDRNNGVVSGLQGRIARTNDGGKTWKFERFDVTIPVEDPLLHIVQLPNKTAWAVGIAGQIVYQDRPGGAWKRPELGMELVSWLSHVDFYDVTNGWIVGGYGLILRTTDGGKTWLPSIG
jgi:photosystem II stability/assembly factor-like uncharacterized protein